VAAFGHDAYLSDGVAKEGDTGRLLANTIRWVGMRRTPRVGYVAGSGHEGVIERLGFTPVPVDAALPTGSLANVDVLITTRDLDATRLLPFVHEGHGVIFATTPWGWLQLNPGKTLLRDLRMNQVLRPAGLAFADGLTETVRPATEADMGAVRADLALESLSKANSGKASALVISALGSIPNDDPFAQEVRRVASSAGPDAKSEGLKRLGITLRHLDRQRGLPAPAVEPGADDFPGAVDPKAPRVNRTVTISLANPQWVSTGLYAAPGERLRVRIPREHAGKGLSLQIGVHSDQNWHHATWARHPSLLTRAEIAAETTISSPFGGLVYVAVDRAGSGTVPVTIEGAVAAARYVHGTTTPEQWRESLKSGAPWAELESKKIVFSVPLHEAKKVDDPKALMDLWDRTMDLLADLDGAPLMARPERIVADRQISAGYMHAGYPIMTFADDSVPLSLNVKRLTSEGTWGHWHELGHNRQSGNWTFEGTGEVTNNLFTLYAMEKVAGKGIWSRIGNEKEKVAAHLANPTFDRWKSEPFLALYMYAQLIEAFGWDSLKKVFRTYQGARIDDDQKKRDEWMVRYSRTVGRNLGPFFQAWGVPTSEAARASIAELPKWMPS